MELHDIHTDENLNKAFNYAFVIIPLAVVLAIIAVGFAYAAFTGSLS